MMSNRYGFVEEGLTYTGEPIPGVQNALTMLESLPDVDAVVAFLRAQGIKGH